MEFSFDFKQLTSSPLSTADPYHESNISIWDANSLLILQKKNGTQYNNMCFALDKLGKASSEAQGLKHIITSASKMINSSYKLFLFAHSKQAFGILKIGRKKLFYATETGEYKEITPLCVMDFYMHESVQRLGLGKKLFEFMLQHENVIPEKIAYDRPSPKLLGFLAKHYNLKDFIPQVNNFVVFKKYFDPSLPEKLSLLPKMNSISSVVAEISSSPPFNQAMQADPPLTTTSRSTYTPLSQSPPSVRKIVSHEVVTVSPPFTLTNHDANNTNSACQKGGTSSQPERVLIRQLYENKPRPFW